MVLPANIAGKISAPLSNLLGYLQYLNGPLSLTTADASGDSETSQEQLGTVVTAKRNFKPFMVGLIPPDIAPDFVPVVREMAGSVLDTIAPSASAGASGSTSSSGVPPKRFTVPNNGLVEREQQTVDVGELRRLYAQAYQDATGRAAPEDIINFMAAQSCLENGRALSSPSFPTWNYNISNIHAPGSREGTYVNNDPNAGIATPPSVPRGGTYFLSTDNKGPKDGNRAYPIYFVGHSSLDEAVKYKVSLLQRAYPEAFEATTADGYVNGLTKGQGGRRYFEADVGAYKKSVGLQLDAIESGIMAGKYGGPLGTPSSNSGDPNTGVGAVEPGDKYVLTHGDVTDAETDPAGDRVGKNLRVDESRLEVVNRQVAALRQQIELIRSTPALLMLVNPSEFSREYEQTADSGTKGRYGNIVHLWLEKPLSINCSGVTAGQYVVSSEGAGGINGEYRVYSASYQNLLSLVLLYKNNGIIYAGQESDRGIPILTYSAFIYYDNHIYIGSFESFEVQDSASKPHNMAYSFKFIARYDMPVGNDGRFTDFEVSIGP